MSQPQKYKIGFYTSFFIGFFIFASPRSSMAQNQAWLDSTHHFQVQIPNTLSSHFVPKPRKKLATFQGKNGLRISVSRIEHPNFRARNRRTKETFFSQIIEGTRMNVPGYKKRSSKLTTIAGVPVLDLQFDRTHLKNTEEVVVRFLFHRRFALVLVAVVPSSAPSRTKKLSKRIARSLQPYFLQQ